MVVIKAILILALFSVSIYIAYAEGQASVRLNTDVIRFDGYGDYGPYFGKCWPEDKFVYCATDRKD